MVLWSLVFLTKPYRISERLQIIRVGESETVPILKFLSGNNRLNIWPEWDDASLANEKWDVPAKGKSDRAARTPGTVREPGFF